MAKLFGTLFGDLAIKKMVNKSLVLIIYTYSLCLSD